MRKQIVVWILCGVVLIGCTCRMSYSKETAPKEENQMSSQLIHLIENGDWTAVQLAEQTGPSVVDSVEPYLNHQDEIVRLLAVDCIVAAGGPKAPALLVAALADSNEQVRINAINGLHQHLPLKHIQILVDAWDQSDDAYVKQQIPLVLGRMDDERVIPQLSSRLAKANTQEIRDGFIAALAKLGREPARMEFVEMLAQARGERIKEMIDYVDYIDEPWLLPPLRPVMDRHEEAIDMSSHRTKVIRRGCDLATDAVIRISQHPFSFQINPIGQYTDVQLQEVISFLDQLDQPPK